MKISLFLILMLAIVFAFCLPAFTCDSEEQEDDAEDDIVKVDITEIPDAVFDFMDESDIQTLIDAGMPIYTGDNPPDIEGTYNFDSFEVFFDEVLYVGKPLCYYEITYLKQDNPKIEQNFISTDCVDSGDGFRGYISGDGNCFTFYVHVTGFASGCLDYVEAQVSSGCLGDGGMTQYFWGEVIQSLQIEGDSCGLPAVGAARIGTEADGFGEKL